jgi:hypothetical protein
MKRPGKCLSVFSMDGYCVWDPSLVKGPDGTWHLFFSRWPMAAGFEAWVTHSEVCRAVAESPFGPYHFAKVVFPKRPGFWDADVTHNPSAQRFGDAFYLYYNGNHGDGTWWDHRNHQRIGVAVATRPEGPWTRYDQPLLDISPGCWDAKVTTNPSCCQGPDGRFLLLYKGVGDQQPGPFFGPVKHGVAFAESPTGPFQKQPRPLFDTGAAFPGEDPFVWSQAGHYYALLKDNQSFYSTESKAIILFKSKNGVDWHITDSPVFQTRNVEHLNGRQEEIYRLERPFILPTEDLFLCAAKPSQDSHKSCILAMRLEAKYEG